MRIVSETFETLLHAPTFELYGSQRKKKKRKAPRKFFEEIIVENFLNMGKEIINPRSTEIPLQDKPKEKHIKTHIKQANRG